MQYETAFPFSWSIFINLYYVFCFVCMRRADQLYLYRILLHFTSNDSYFSFHSIFSFVLCFIKFFFCCSVKSLRAVLNMEWHKSKYNVLIFRMKRSVEISISAHETWNFLLSHKFFITLTYFCLSCYIVFFYFLLFERVECWSLSVYNFSFPQNEKKENL